MKNKVLYWLLGILAGLGLFAFGWSTASNYQSVSKINPGFSSQSTQSIFVLVDDGVKLASYKLASSRASNVFSALQAVAAANKLKLDYDASSPLGVFIKQIGENKNGTDSKYWQYWVNGDQPLVAADKFNLSGGETILWAFRKSEF